MTLGRRSQLLLYLSTVSVAAATVDVEVDTHQNWTSGQFQVC